MIEKIVGEAATKDSCCPDLDYKTRIFGFCITFGIGVLCYMFSLSVFLIPYLFGLVFTTGSICSTMATFFLCGPKKQWKNMMKPYRATISLVFLGTIVATVVLGFILSGNKIVIALLAAAQFCAMVWYALSYIPFGRKFCGTCLKTCCCKDKEGSYSEI